LELNLEAANANTYVFIMVSCSDIFPELAKGHSISLETNTPDPIPQGLGCPSGYDAGVTNQTSPLSFS